MIQEIAHAGWKRNMRLQGPTTELIITLDVGPRILHYAFRDSRNVFVELPAQLGSSGESKWMLRGGHRFWTAPEAAHSYDLDNVPVDYKKIGDAGIEIASPASSFGFQKTLQVEMLKDEVIRVTHLLTNADKKPINLTPWALSVMAAGGHALIPQPPRDIHPTEFPETRQEKPEDFLPNREVVLWPFTNLSDERFKFTEHFLRVNHHPSLPATKIGLRQPTGWVAYQNQGVVFAKHFVTDLSKPYPDQNSNFELFTNHEILELESLAPILPLAPGETRKHVEHWVLRKADLREEKAAKAFFDGLPKV